MNTIRNTIAVVTSVSLRVGQVTRDDLLADLMDELGR